MRVRALVDVYLGKGLGYKAAGKEFDYEGPLSEHFAVVEEPAVPDPELQEAEVPEEPPSGRRRRKKNG